MFNAIIVDDESMARVNLKDALRLHKNWQCVAELSSGEQLLTCISEAGPEVVFLDIKMPGESGLALARELLKLQQPPLVVFVTAYDEHALSAFDLYAVDYLLKPFDSIRFSQCIRRLESILSGELSSTKAYEEQSAFLNAEPLQKLVIKSASSIRIVEIKDVQWVGACGNYLEIHHTEGRHLFRCSLKQLVTSLPTDQFIQVHRSYVVRTSLAREVHSLQEERFELHLSTGAKVPVGGTYKDRLLEFMCS